MKALDRKLLRDLARMWSQAATIALVVASGVGGWLTSLSAVDSLAAARDRYYVEGRFADVFAELVRAPRDAADALLAVSGVSCPNGVGQTDSGPQTPQGASRRVPRRRRCRSRPGIRRRK